MCCNNDLLSVIATHFLKVLSFIIKISAFIHFFRVFFQIWTFTAWMVDIEQLSKSLKRRKKEFIIHFIFEIM